MYIASDCNVTFTNYLSCEKSNVWGFVDCTVQTFFGSIKESAEKKIKKHEHFSITLTSNLKVL
jgi:hypothetical protein